MEREEALALEELKTLLARLDNYFQEIP